jgi:WhiB family redox-sensing transcriptional regulator
MERASCRDYPQEWFFPEQGDDVRPGLAVCAECPVRIQCFDYALNSDFVLAGIWGGTTGNQRTRMRLGKEGA